MLIFREETKKAQDVSLYYTEKLDRQHLNEVFECKRDVLDRNEAIELAQFYWDMLDASALDRENGVEVLGECDLQFWMEKLLNIIGGYLERCGYETEWEKVSDGA